MVRPDVQCTYHTTSAVRGHNVAGQTQAVYQPSLSLESSSVKLIFWIASMSRLGASKRNSCDLIVDFPDRNRNRNRRQLSGSGTRSRSEMTATTTTTKKLEVSFCENTVTYCFQYPSSEEVSKRWYCRRDKRVFMQEMARDVRSIRYLLSTTPMEAVENEALYGCVGLEAHLSSEVTRFLKDKKRGHARSIVEMQHFLNEEQLAACAMSHSSQSRESAQKLASGYLEILA